MTITTLDRNLQKVLEASSERINTLKIAQEKGIKTWVFLGRL